MVRNLSIGILGIQGAISEHLTAMTNVLKEKDYTDCKVIVIRTKKDIDKIDALIIPGGESSTIYKVLVKSGLYEPISKRIKNNNLPILGTCAGCVLLANEIVNNTKKIKPFNAMEMQVERNAFGRQKESFEQNVQIKSFKRPYYAVFIRAPIIKKVWGGCEILSKIDKKIIATRQDKYLASSFHPELTEDLRIHEYFLDMIF